MKKPKRTNEEIRELFLGLAESARLLNIARDDLRATANKLAGVVLEDWSMEDIADYVDMAIAEMQAQLYIPQYNEAIVKVEQVLEGIWLARIAEVMQERKKRALRR